MGHKESKIFEKVEEAIANQNETNTKSLEKKVLILWKSLDKNHQGYLDKEQATEFFGTVYEYCKTTLKHEGIVFDPSTSKDALIESWIKEFDLEKQNKITYDGFCLALKACASACHKDLRERELAQQEAAANTTSPGTIKSQSATPLDEVHEAEEKLLSELSGAGKEKEKELEKMEKKKAKETSSSTPSTLRKVFAQNQNPLLNQTFEYKIYLPKEVASFITPAWHGARSDDVINKLTSSLPLEYSSLGLNVIFDGIPDAGLSTIMEKYCSTKESREEGHPLSFAECTRDLFNIGTLIPIKIYKYSPRNAPTDPYIKFSSGLQAKVDLWVFVLNITKALDEATLSLISHRMRLVNEFFKLMKLKPALLFIGNKLDEREIREFSFEEGSQLANKYGAMYTEMSSFAGVFVVRGLNEALRASIGVKEQRQLFANIH